MNKYEQIINYYRQQIVDKVLKPGDQLPNEIEIAQAFKVSRMTANKMCIRDRITPSQDRMNFKDIEKIFAK